MLEIYRRNENGEDRLVAFYDTYEELFRWRSEDDFQTFGYTPHDRTDHNTCFNDSMFCPNLGNYKDTRYCYVAYQNDKLITPDRLVGKFRDYEYERESYQYRWWRKCTRKYDSGQKKTVWGHLRKIHTTPERRWAHAWDDEPDAPKCRGRRSASNLPNSWDDYWSQAQKSWKWQSKRKHQWK